jgi:predicted amino acid-binding ACT domain protein
MKTMKTLALASVVAFAAGCAHDDRADYDRDLHPRTYSGTERMDATSDIDTTPDRVQPTDLLRADPDGRIVPERYNEQLKAGPQTQFDQQLAGRIREVLQKRPDFQGNVDDISIKVMRGRVTLKGHVDSDEERRAIEALAYEFAGVNYVDNQLHVGGDDDDDDEIR